MFKAIKPLGAALLAIMLGAACSEKTEVVETAPAEPSAQYHGEAPTTGGIDWYPGSVDEAFAAARESNKPIFLYWGAAWCPPCHQLKATIFLEDEFIAQSRLFVPVYLDGDTPSAQMYGERFGVMGYPTVIVFNPAGEEITRIPGGIDLDRYLTVLELSLNAMRPVSSVLAVVQSGGAISDEDWMLLANYSWWQDRGQALGEQSPGAVLGELADTCPESLPFEKSKLQMMALSAWLEDENRDGELAAGYIEQLSAVLASPEHARQSLGIIIMNADGLINTLATPDTQRAMQGSIVQLLKATIEDPELSVLTRLEAVYGWVAAQTALLDEAQSMSQPQLEWLREQVGRARGAANSYQQHAALYMIGQIYHRAGLDSEARATLIEGMRVSDQPYYFMADMGYLARQAGNGAEALAWYRKAWDASEGPATRFQWGSNYLRSLLALSPDDLEEIARTGATILGELSEQQDGLAQRTTARVNSVSRDVLLWVEPAQGAATTARQRARVAQRMRLDMDKLCADVSPSTEAAKTCANFLVPSQVEKES